MGCSLRLAATAFATREIVHNLFSNFNINIINKKQDSVGRNLQLAL